MESATSKEQLLKALHPPAPESVVCCQCGRASAQLLNNGICAYHQDGQLIRRFYAKAESEDGRRIDTRTARLLSQETVQEEGTLGACKVIRALYESGTLQLRQEICACESGELVTRIALHSTAGQTATRFLAPVVTPYPGADEKPVFLSLDQKMLTVPYDNDMWSHYESAVPACGRRSYDVAALYDEQSGEGFVMGALDFSVWKNAIRWLHNDARGVMAYCGAADEGTHDVCPHGVVRGEWVESSRFVLFWSEEIRDGMERYGDLCARVSPPRTWKSQTVPFGWNSFSALGMGITLPHWQEAGEFIRRELPNFSDADGAAYINLDGAFGLDKDAIRKIICELHEKGQKAGWYAIPCNWFSFAGDMPAPGTDIPMKELFLRDHAGNLLPAIDNSQPLDVTHPQWETMARTMIRELVDLGVDYIKIDFLSHGSVEGAHYRADYTGRMALHHAYSVLSDELEKAEREIFVSLSIAPLFPAFLGHARRCCCDSFGHHEDVRYVLNALNFAWWTNGRLYRFNDPDHVALYHSVIDGRGATTENEARSRYYSAVISGTVMMLSDNYGPQGDPESIERARERARRIANNEAVNKVARLGRAFRPVYLRDGTTPFYTLCHEGRYYVAVFNFADRVCTLSFPAADGGLPEQGTLQELSTGARCAYHAEIRVTLESWDAAIYEIIF